MARRLGEILVELGACHSEQVAEALESQELVGGRLGTNLLELGALTEEALSSALSRRHGVPAVHGEIALDSRVVALLRPGHADRLDVLPYSLSGRRLAVLCLDPSDLRKLDEVAFATGKEVVPIVVPEARLWALLRAAHGLERPMRGLEVDWGRKLAAIPLERDPVPEAPDLMSECEFEALYSERTTVSALSGPSTPQPTPASAAPAAPTSRTSPFPSSQTPAPPTASSFGVFVSTDEVLATLQSEASLERPQDSLAIAIDGALATAPPPLSFEEASAALADVADRSAVARVVLRYACSRFKRAVLLTVHARGAYGWEGLGEGLTPQTVARVHVPLGTPGIVQTVVETRSHVLGPLGRTEANLRLLRALAGGAPRNAFAMPILARGKVVDVLYADNGRGGLVEPDGVGELLILASRISQSHDALLEGAR
jgi:hypothetical protein